MLTNYPAKTVKRAYGGFNFVLRITDPLAEAWYGSDTPAIPEIEFLRQYRLRPGAKVFDLGAHQCVVAMVLSRIVGDTGLVVAVEANEHNAEVGLENKALNEMANLRVIHAAVSDRPGVIAFADGLNGQAHYGVDEHRRKEVKALSVDDLADRFGIPEVMFIDVEGYECHVLAGAKRSLASNPDCMVEVHVGVGLENLGGSVEAIAAYFPKDRFDLYMASDLHQVPLPFEPNHNITLTRFYITAIGKDHAP